MNSKMRRTLERQDIELNEDEQNLLKELTTDKNKKQTTKKEQAKAKIKSLREKKNKNKENKATKRR